MSSNAFDLALKKIYMDLLVKHRHAGRDLREQDRARIFEMLDDIEWLYPDKDFYV